MIDKKWIKKWFWNNFWNKLADEKFYYELFNWKVTLQWLYSLYFNAFLINKNDLSYEEYANKYISEKNRTIFLNFLSWLIESWELDMKIFSWEWDNKFVKPKYFSKDNYQEWIVELKKRWFEITDISDRRIFEDYSVQFTIPWNDYLY